MPSGSWTQAEDRYPSAGRWRQCSRLHPRIRPARQNYLFDALIASILQQPLQSHLIITIGQANDPTNDDTIPWPDAREQVDAGTLTLDHVGSEDTSPCRDINFDPLVLPEGMAPSDDPLLNARSAVYSGRSPDAQARRTTERGYAFRGAKVSMSGVTEQQQFPALM